MFNIKAHIEVIGGHWRSLEATGGQLRCLELNILYVRLWGTLEYKKSNSFLILGILGTFSTEVTFNWSIFLVYFPLGHCISKSIVFQQLTEEDSTGSSIVEVYELTIKREKVLAAEPVVSTLNTHWETHNTHTQSWNSSPRDMKDRGMKVLTWKQDYYYYPKY